MSIYATMPKLSVELTETEHKKLKSAAAWLGLSQMEIVRRFLLAWFAREIELPEESSHEQPKPHILAE